MTTFAFENLLPAFLPLTSRKVEKLLQLKYFQRINHPHMLRLKIPSQNLDLHLRTSSHDDAK